MKIITATLLTFILSFIAGIYIEFWWSFVIISFLVGLFIHQKPFKAFLSGFLGLFLLWGVLSFWIDWKNNSILSTKIATLLPLSGSPILLIIVTAFVGGLLSGTSALNGSLLRKSNKD